MLTKQHDQHTMQGQEQDKEYTRQQADANKHEKRRKDY